MSHSKPQYIRKAIREKHVLIERVTDVGFADEFYSQLQDVCSKSMLVPTYSLERVRALIECLLPTGRLLLVRARDRAGHSIATGIFPAFNGTMYALGQASWRAYLKLHPNEPLHWFAMRYWKARGMLRYDMVGDGDYKKQYGGRLVGIPRVIEPRWPVIGQCRRMAEYCYEMLRRLRWLRQHARSKHEK